MDAEWVGIAGVAGTLIGTLGASWIGFRQFKGQLQAQRTEAERQRRFESLRERRESRERAYAEFMASAQAAMNVITQNFANAHNSHSHTLLIDSHIDAITLSNRAGMVTIMGPKGVANAADAFVAYLAHVGNFEYVPGSAGNEPHAMDRISRLSTRLEAFAKAAQAALEDHGQDSDP